MFLAKVLIAGTVLLSALPFLRGEQPERGCSFRANGSDVLEAEAHTRRQMYDRVQKAAAGIQRAAVSEAPPLRRRNLIDDAIFSRLDAARVAPARLSTDEEFVRRIYLDLTGRIPAANDVHAFLLDQSASKRDDLIERLLASPEFNDKWATWLGDLLQNVDRLATNARAPQIEGRNAFRVYLRDAVGNSQPLSTIAREAITATGNNYFTENGAANYPVLASAAMGPAQDTYDMMLVRAATAFLGMGNYDCLLCHNGRGHLDNINLWAQGTLRVDAERMAAHFSRMRLNNGAPGAKQYESPLYNSTQVSDAAAGQYELSTTFGNRPNRVPNGTERSLTPVYRDGTKPAGNTNWRAAFAEKVIADPMFGRNFGNRLWKQFFGLGLVDPVDTLDPARLDPANPPPAPWTMQASHPALLEALAKYFFDNNADLRAFVRLLVQSTAYQLSSAYDGEWKYEYLSLFARHYPRRLQGEEVHDAVTAATGVPGRYTWALANSQTVPRGTPVVQSEPVAWAMQLPDPTEPRNNAGARNFMLAFYRGNRDTAQRAQAGSILQELNLMNDPFVLSRLKLNASPTLREISRISDDAAMIEELFLTFLSRKPTAYETGKAQAYLSRNNTPQRRSMALEDLAWACVNKLDFVFSY